MSKDANGQAEQDVQEGQAAKPSCKCCHRFRRFLVWLLVIVIVGGGAAYWYCYLRVYNLQVCQDAMKTIKADKGMQETLGLPMKNAYVPSQETMPSARVEENEVDAIWTIEGPKNHARAHVNARRRQGRWDIVTLEVTPAGGKKVSVHEPESDEGGAPAWPNPGTAQAPATGPNAKKPEAKGPETPGPDINMAIPPGDGPPK